MAQQATAAERHCTSRPAPYFHGSISPADAAALLLSAEAGSFLIGFGAPDRLSFTLHYTTAAEAAPQHADIRASGGGYAVDAAGQSWTGESLTQLVLSILSSPGTPLPHLVACKRFLRAEAASPTQSASGDAGVLLFVVGNSTDGALGMGAVVAVCTPTPIPRPRLAAAGRFARLAIGSGHVIGITREGAAWGWGANAAYQLGLGVAASRAVDAPREIPALLGHRIVAAAAGDKHSLFLSASGDVFATGFTSTGACGVGFSPPVVKTPVALAFFTRRPFRRRDPAVALLQPALPSLSLMLERWDETHGEEEDDVDEEEEGGAGDAASTAAGVTASPAASPAGIHGRAAATTQHPPPLLPLLSATSQSPAVKRQLGQALAAASHQSDDAGAEIGCVTSPDAKDARSAGASSHRRLGSISNSRRSLTSRSGRSYSSTVLTADRGAGGSVADSRTNSLSASGFLAARLAHGTPGGASSHALVADASYRSSPSGASDEDMLAIAARGTTVGLRKTVGTAAASGSSPSGTVGGRATSAAAGAAMSPPAAAAASSGDANEETWSDAYEGEPAADHVAVDGVIVSPASPVGGAAAADAAHTAASTTPAKRVLLSSTSAAKPNGGAGSAASKPAPVSAHAVSPAPGGSAAAADAEPPDVIVDVQAGGDTSFAVSLLGRVYAWGANSFGQTGTGAKGNVPRPLPVHDLRQERVKQVSAGPEHAVFVTEAGQAFATGCNTYGRLGLGDDVDRCVVANGGGGVALHHVC